MPKSAMIKSTATITGERLQGSRWYSISAKLVLENYVFSAGM